MPNTDTPTRLDDAAIADLTDDAINAIALIVQTKLGITDGGPASLFYSDPEQRQQVAECVRAYLSFELSPAGSCPEVAGEPLTFAACKDLKAGERVAFVGDFDIFPEAIVQDGCACTVISNGLGAAEGDTFLTLYPDDKTVRAKLADWDGHILISVDPLPDNIPAADGWCMASPIALLTTVQS